MCPAKSRLSQCTITESQFADDAALYTHSVTDMDAAAALFVTVATQVALTVSFGKTKCMVISDDPPPTGCLTLADGDIEIVNEFTYLGSCITNDGQLSVEVSSRLAKASRSFDALRSAVFGNRHISVRTKTHVYSAVVLSTLLYGCESWAVKATDTRRLSVFHNRCARFILDVSKSEQWNEHLSNAVTLERAGLRSVVEMLRTRRLRWLGHVGRMSDDRIPKCVLFGELQKTRPRHGPRKRWRDNIVIDLEERHINDWYSLAEDRRAWRLACNTIRPPKPRSRDFRCHCGRGFRRRQELIRHSKFCAA